VPDNEPRFYLMSAGLSSAMPCANQGPETSGNGGEIY